MSSATSPALPTFSYAQAAKGKSQPQTIPQQSLENTASTKDANTLASRPSAIDRSKSELSDRADPTKVTNEPRESAAVTPGSPHAVTDVPAAAPLPNGTGTNSDPSFVNSSTAATETKQVSTTSSPSFGTASTSTLPKEDEIAFTPNGSSESTSWDKQSQVSTSAEKSTQTTDGPKEKDSETSWGETPIVPPESQYKAAPIPVVNIWQQRKEAQEAKAKANATMKPISTSQPAQKAKATQAPEIPAEQAKSGSEPARAGSKKKGTATNDRDDVAGLKEKKRSGETGKGQEEASRKSGNRPSRSPGKDKDNPASTIPPPVGDASFWPTPEIAKEEDKKKNQEKVEKPETKQPGSKPHAKQKWATVPYVPTAVFNTPLPPAAARRGGRGSRGGRDGAGRGGHAVNNSTGGEKSEKPVSGSMGPPPLPKQSGENDRGRNEDGPSRSNSVPAPSRRASSAGPLATEQRKSNQGTQSARSNVEKKGPQSLDIPAKPADTEQVPNSEDQAKPPRNRQESRSVSRGTASSHVPVQQGIDATRQPTLPSDSHTHTRFNGADRRSMPPDFFKNPETFMSRDRGDFSKEIEFSKGRDLSKERQEYPRDGSDFVKERDFSGDRRETRGERGRGGWRGGRSSHSNYANPQQQTHSFTAPIPQQPFPPHKSHSFNERQRQQQSSGAHQSQSQHSQSNRSSLRSHSIPNSAMYGALPNGIPSGPPPLSPIQTDLNAMYGFQQQMHPGYMSAVPYNAYFEQIHLQSLISQQVEYYFSVDNLCKDMFLRSQMDSQGYVPFEVIANFKRMKLLTPDVEIIKSVCRNLRDVEFRPGEDGIDRLRKRDKWEQWIVPMEQRVPTAQNEGPPSSSYSRPPSHFDGHHQTGQDGQMVPPYDPSATLPWTNGSMQEALSASGATPYPIPNGSLEGHITQTPLSSDAPSFAPQSFDYSGNNPIGAANFPNENVFPDEQIPALNILVRRPGLSPGPLSPPAPSTASRTMSQGSINGEAALDDQANGHPVLGLRGGAAPAEMLEEERLRQHRSPPLSQTPIRSFGKVPPLWVKNSETPVGVFPDDFEVVTEPYLTFRERALAQREAPGDDKPDMDHLYEFWADFLVKSFNASIYREFRNLATDDAYNHSHTGLKYLVCYYDATLNLDRPMPDEIASDMVEFVKKDGPERRQAYQNLRAAWRNGAFNMKSRYKVDRILDADLKAELEK